MPEPDRVIRHDSTVQSNGCGGLLELACAKPSPAQGGWQGREKGPGQGEGALLSFLCLLLLFLPVSYFLTTWVQKSESFSVLHYK